MSDLGRALVILGLVLAALGAVLTLAPRLPWLGRLPGDIQVERGNWTIYVPLGTSILVSLVLTLILWVFGRR
jgi:hypothetical protein